MATPPINDPNHRDRRNLISRDPKYADVQCDNTSLRRLFSFFGVNAL